MFALPGDPVKAMFGDKPVNEAVAAQIRAEYNLDKPFIVQYLLFLKNALTLDFGKTFSGQLVIDQIGRAFPVTIKLALMAFRVRSRVRRDLRRDFRPEQGQVGAIP